MNAKTAKALRKLIKQKYKDPLMAKYIYKQVKKEMK